MYHDGNGSIVGMAPEFVQKALEGSGYKAHFRYEGPWEQVQEKAKKGEVDIVVAVYKTDERQKYMLYSEPYILDPVSIFVVNEDLLSLTIEEVISSKHGIVTKGDSYGAEIDELLKKEGNLSTVQNLEEAKEMLLSGGGDYFLYSTFSGEEFFKEDGEVFTSTVGAELFYMGVSEKTPGAENIVRELNKYIGKNNLLT